MRIDTFAQPYRKAWVTNANTSSFASRIPTTTPPTNDGVVDLVGTGALVCERLLILPYGLGANNDAFDMRVIGWRHIGDPPNATKQLWVPTTLAEFNCTVGNITGVAASQVLNTEFFCDTIVLATAANKGLFQPRNTNVDGQATPALYYTGPAVEIFSPANDTVAWIKLHVQGSERVEFIFDQTTNSPTCNALIAAL